MAGQNDQWETSKENIQPLRHGRQAAVLNAALDESTQHKLMLEKQEFEKELRTYSGEDILEIWYRYAGWVEQNYPKGGLDGKWKELVEKCFTAIHGDDKTNEQYMNDPRFLELWIKYASMTPNPLEIYQMLDNKGLCVHLSEFYESWAWELEKINNFKKADKVYILGLDRGAQPIDVLLHSHNKFQTRAAQGFVAGKNEAQQNEPQRLVLSRLQTQGRHAATDRVSSIRGTAGRVGLALGDATNALGKNVQTAPSFQIYQEETGSEKSSAMSSDGTNTLPIGLGTNTENEMMPRPWSRARVGQKTTSVVPVEEVKKGLQPAFALHEDDAEGNASTVIPRPSIGGGILCNRKVEFKDWHVPTFLPEEFNPMSQPQYCKSKVYCGTEEFSFEELRSAKWFKQQKKESEEFRQQLKDEMKVADLLKLKQDQLHESLTADMQELKPLVQKQDRLIKSLSADMQELKPLVQKQDKRIESLSVEVQELKSLMLKKDQLIESLKEKLTKSAAVQTLAENLITNINLKEENVENNTATVDKSCLSASVHLVPLETGSADEDTVGHSCCDNSHSGSVHAPFSVTAGLENLWQGSILDIGNSQPLELPSAAADDTVIAEPVLPPQLPFTLFYDDAPIIPFQESVPVPQTSSSVPSSQVQSVPFTSFSDNANHLDTPLVDDKENIVPQGYLRKKETRQICGVLQPAMEIPLTASSDDCEEFQSVQQDDDVCCPEVVGFHPSNVEDDYTVPLSVFDFERMASIASTPAPASFGRVPHVMPEPDDCTMAVIKRSSQAQNEPSNFDSQFGKDEASTEMPPPVMKVTRRSIPNTKSLSPIHEASHEYRSSSSSSSSSLGYSTTISNNILQVSNASHVTLHSTLTVTRNLSSPFCNDARDFPLDCQTTLGDYSKSGYLADKSRGDYSKSGIAEKLDFSKCGFGIKSEFPITKIDEKSEIDNYEDFKCEIRSSEIVAPNTIESPKLADNFLKIVHNPFDQVLISDFLNNLSEQIETRAGYVSIDENLPVIKPGVQLSLGDDLYLVRRQRGCGAYATVFQASTFNPLDVTVLPSAVLQSDDDDDVSENEHHMVLKVEKPACQWEFYVCHELRQRLKATNASSETLSAFMRLNRGYFFCNGSVLVTQYHHYGSLLDVMNEHKKVGQSLPEEFVLYLMVQLLYIVESMHHCNIIHADIKPDNVLLMSLPKMVTIESLNSGVPDCIKLIDFGRSIDMRMFPKGTCFTHKVETDKFVCCEMQDNRPWSYQTDLYCLAATAHCLLFGQYMEVVETHSGWRIKSVLKRYWQRKAWNEFFEKLLNVPPNKSMACLTEVRKALTEALTTTGKFRDVVFRSSGVGSLFQKRI